MRGDGTNPTDIVVIGHGAIGSMVVDALRDPARGGRVRGVLVRPERGAETLAALAAETEVFTTIEAALAVKPHLVLECAGQDAVREYGEKVLSAGVDLVVIAVGALADDDFRERLIIAAESGGARIILPAGAIAGIDGLTALALGGLDHVRYVSSKPPAAWKGTPADAALDLDSLSQATTIFEGSARDAARLYPKNANIAAIVALAGIGLDRTEVTLVADPGLGGNVGNIEAEGRYGRLSITSAGHAAPGNPKTSASTALSIVNVVRNRAGVVIIG